MAHLYSYFHFPPPYHLPFLIPLSHWPVVRDPSLCAYFSTLYRFLCLYFASCKWDRHHMVFKLVCLLYFTQHYIPTNIYIYLQFKLSSNASFSCKCLKCHVFLLLNSILLYILHFLYSVVYWWIYRLLQQFSYYELCCFQH